MLSLYRSIVRKDERNGNGMEMERKRNDNQLEYLVHGNQLEYLVHHRLVQSIDINMTDWKLKQIRNGKGTETDFSLVL